MYIVTMVDNCINGLCVAPYLQELVRATSLTAKYLSRKREFTFVTRQMDKCSITLLIEPLKSYWQSKSMSRYLSVMNMCVKAFSAH